MPNEKMLTTGQVAARCHVSHTTTVQQWIRDGDPKAYRLPGGRYCILESDFREFLDARGMPVDEALFGEAVHGPRIVLF